jgi:hypothetical protein
MGGDTLAVKTKKIEFRKNHDTSDIPPPPIVQSVNMWSRHAQAGQDRPVDSRRREHGTHTGIDPRCPFTFFSEYFLKSDKVF